MEILRELFQKQDVAYRDFQLALIPTVRKERIIGVRTPELRAMAKALRGSDEAAAFLRRLPHLYFEENQLHAFLIELIADFDACVAALDVFLPHVDNWATCDSMSPKVLGRNKEALRVQVERWLASSHPYTVRYGVGTLMRWFLDGDFLTDDLCRVAALRSEDYYVKMMVAWYFATALAKQYDAALPFLEASRLPQWTHNKAIQKALESRRLSPEQKQHLKTLKR